MSETPATFDAGLQPEPVSPELVLVDPELAERERARLREKARLETLVDIATIRRAVETHATPPESVDRGFGWHELVEFSRRRVLPAALMCSLLLNGLLVAHLVVRTGGADSSAGVPLAVRPATVNQATTGHAAGGAVLPDEPARSRTRTTSAARGIARSSSHERDVTKASVERRLITLIIAASARRLPRALVDPKTGLLKNNVQVVCRQDEARSFLCSIRLPTFRPQQGLYVRYRSRGKGKGVFEWYGYRDGSNS